MLTEWAESYAEKLLKPLGDRWTHTNETAQQAARVSAVLPKSDRDVLVAAAYLHDLGYAPQVAKSGFHPLDGAINLRELGVDYRVCCLVAHHSAARFEAEERGLLAELVAYEREDSPVMDALTYADMTTGSAGQTVKFGDRMNEILRRYKPEDPVARVISQRTMPALNAAVERTVGRLDTGTSQPI